MLHESLDPRRHDLHFSGAKRLIYLAPNCPHWGTHLHLDVAHYTESYSLEPNVFISFVVPDAQPCTPRILLVPITPWYRPLGHIDRCIAAMRIEQ